MDGERPVRPQGAQELGLTDSVWDMTVHCWSQDPARRPIMTEVAGLLRELLASSLSVEVGLSAFFHVCNTWDKDDQRKKAWEFADRLDQVRHTEKRDIRSSHHTPRLWTTQIFTNENANNI